MKSDWVRNPWISNTAGLLVFSLLLGGASLFFEQSLDPYQFRVVVNCGIACILALSLNLINGCAGQFSLGHAGFMAVGAYTSAFLTTIYPGPVFFSGFLQGQLSILIGGIAAGFAGYLVGLPSLRLRGDYLAIVTLGFGEIIRVVLLNFESVGGARGLPGIPRNADFFIIYLWAFITFIFLFRLLRSTAGRSILALRDDEIAAESMGVNVSKYKVFAFVVSSFFAGIAGALFAHYQGFIDPQSFNFNRSVEVVIMVVLGGSGSLSGSLLGAFVVTLLPEQLRIFNEYRLIVFPLLLILVMLLRPMGLMGHREIWDLWKSKKGERRG